MTPRGGAPLELKVDVSPCVNQKSGRSRDTGKQQQPDCNRAYPPWLPSFTVGHPTGDENGQRTGEPHSCNHRRQERWEATTFRGTTHPTGSKIVFGSYDSAGTGVGLYIVDSNGSGLHLLLKEMFQPVNDGSWSPRGDKIVFSRHLTGAAPGSIWLINSDGTGLHPIRVAGLDCGGAAGCHEPQ